MPFNPIISRASRQFSWEPLTAQEITQRGVGSNLAQINLARRQGAFTPRPQEEYDYLSQAQSWIDRSNDLVSKIAQQRYVNATTQAQNQINRAQQQSQQNYQNQLGRYQTPPMFRSFKNPSPQFMAFAQAISGQESGGSYGAVNPDSGALGRYQVLPSNIAGRNTGWDYEVLGRDITPQRYLNSQRLQDRIALTKLRGMFRQEGVRGAASQWYSGDPNAWQDTRSQGDYPSISNYVSSVYGKYRQNLRQWQRRNQALGTMTGLRQISDPLKGRGNFTFGPEGDYGTRTIGQGWHTGVDFDAPAGTPIYAAQSGRVGVRGWDDGYGNQIFINGANKSRTRYTHMQNFAKGIKKGDYVRKGQLIGYVGNTGSYSQGNHLHFETWRRGHETNPLRWFRRSGVI